jgi:hypothetical protein
VKNDNVCNISRDLALYMSPLGKGFYLDSMTVAQSDYALQGMFQN